MDRIKSNTARLTVASLLVVVGIILPYFTGHAFGIPGNVFLPMHLPVLLCGFLCGPMLGLAAGIVTPLLSSLLTGMPAAFPMLPIMLGELACYGLCSGLFYQKLKWNRYLALLASMLCGRVVYGIIFTILFQLNGGMLKALTVQAAVVAGVPGIIVQIIVLPIILQVLRATNDKMEDRI